MNRWLPPEELEFYEPVSRSMRIEGYSTSIRLERIFWDVLDRMAAEQRQSLCGLVGSIYQEMHSSHEPLNNFSSVLRVICLKHMGHQHPEPPLANESDGDAHPGADSQGIREVPSRAQATACPSCGLRSPR